MKIRFLLNKFLPVDSGSPLPTTTRDDLVSVAINSKNFPVTGGLRGREVHFIVFRGTPKVEDVYAYTESNGLRLVTIRELVSIWRNKSLWEGEIASDNFILVALGNMLENHVPVICVTRQPRVHVVVSLVRIWFGRIWGLGDDIVFVAVPL